MSISNRLLSSSFFLILNQLIQRSLGLISTLILARLLTPADFGIVAMVAVTLHFFDLISDVGSQSYLIQKDKVCEDDFNTAWSIELILKLALTVILILLAPLIADFFSMPQLTLAIQVIAIVLPIKALRNPMLAQLARDISYKKLVYLQVVQKIFSFFIVMTVVFIHTSYWALIAGDIAAAIIFTLGSYYIIRFSPKWSLSRIKDQWHFSQWLLLRSIVGFFRAQMDTGFVAKLNSSEQLGGYHLSRELALLPALNLIIPALEPLLAAIAEGKNNPQTLAYRIRFSLFSLLMLIVPLSVFIWFFSYEIIAVILGDQWIAYHTILQYFALLFFTYPIFVLLGDSFIAVGKVKQLFYFDLGSTLLLGIVLYLAKDLSIESFAFIRALSSMVLTFVFLYFMNSLVSYQWGKLTYLSAPIILAAFTAAWITQYLKAILDLNLFFQLVIISANYFLIYGILLALSYQLFFSKSEEVGHVNYLLKQQWQKLVIKIKSD